MSEFHAGRVRTQSERHQSVTYNKGVWEKLGSQRGRTKTSVSARMAEVGSCDLR